MKKKSLPQKNLDPAGRNQVSQKNKPVRIMFQDEAGFGRINTPKYCWMGGIRPVVPCHHFREYRYAFGAVDPCSGDSFFLVMPWGDTICTNIFLEHLSQQYAKEEILLICNGAAWHKSKDLVVPKNIYIYHIPPYTPEMNPIEQIWREIRARGFKNEVFNSLEDIIEHLCLTIVSLATDTVKSITGRDWILQLF